MPEIRSANYVTRIHASPSELSAAQWDGLLVSEADPSPFLRHAYLSALHESGCATEQAGWQPQFLTLWLGEQLVAACPMYLKNHSYGEYVFDWAWANAYAEHGLDYYPKALVSIPFTPVPGVRLLARDEQARAALVKALIDHTRAEQLSSLHLLFIQPRDVAACETAGMMLRHTVQFHWTNCSALPAADPDVPADGERAQMHAKFENFDHFLSSLVQEKRKKIRQERRKVAQAGIEFRSARGSDITASDWHFFYRCYERTYLEHGNAPYLNQDFFHRVAQSMPDHWVMFIAERDGQPIASSLIVVDANARVAYGRYWGALQRVDCLHFEACYYQPLDWCIRHGIERFEGGAQGEHKMARALLPVKTTSAHWLAHPSFAEAVERFLAREDRGVDQYLDHLASRRPLRAITLPPAGQNHDPHRLE